MKNEKNFLSPPTSKKFFRSLWEPVKGTFSKSGGFKQKGDKNLPIGQIKISFEEGRYLVEEIKLLPL